jgi:hypothetical protein
VSGTDWGPGDVGGGPPGASPEGAGALDGRREREKWPAEHPAPRPGCLRTLIAIVLLLLGLAFAWFLFGLVVDLLG